MKHREALPLILVLGLAFGAVQIFSSRNVEPHTTIRHADDTSFAAALASKPPLKLVEFGASWCGPCRRLQPTLNKLAEWQPEHVAVVQVDVDESPNVSADHRVRSIPALFLYQESELLGTTSERSFGALQNWITPHIPSGKTP